MVDEKIKILLCKGKNNITIAKEVGLSVSGVKYRIEQLRQQYKASNRIELAVKIAMLQFYHEVM